MVKATIKGLIAFSIFFLNILAAQAQNTLDSIKIEQYLSTLPSLARLEEKYKAADNSENEEYVSMLDSPEITRTPISDGLIRLRDHPRYDEFKDIVTDANFSDPEEWASTGDQIMMAYSAYQLKYPESANAPSLAEIKKDMQEDLEKINKNQFISAEQKQTLINKIENSMALLNDPNYIDSENISIISPYIERLNTLFKEYQ
tara:strand:+ start:770 stop:1375 length:606 start_codon:yes stop_codon:yes gene_type:complete